jgi:hypothetical protein
MLKCGRGNFKSTYKIVSLIILSGSILLLPSLSFAQGGDLPCGGDDPTSNNPCPLDTWVWILALIAMAFGTIYLHRQQKSVKNA